MLLSPFALILINISLCCFREVEALILSTVRMVFVRVKTGNLFSMNRQMNIEILLGCIVAYTNGSSDKTLTAHGANIIGDSINRPRHNVHSNSRFPIFGACCTQNDAEGSTDSDRYTTNTSKGTIWGHGLFLRPAS